MKGILDTDAVRIWGIGNNGIVVEGVIAPIDTDAINRDLASDLASLAASQVVEK